jgi:phage-related protein
MENLPSQNHKNPTVSPHSNYGIGNFQTFPNSRAQGLQAGSIIIETEKTEPFHDSTPLIHSKNFLMQIDHHG